MAIQFSSRFRGSVGGDNTDELVTVLDSMHDRAFAELRALNETNFVRFDARLEQRTAEIRTGMAELRGELRSEMHEGYERLERKIDQGHISGLRWYIAMTMTTLMSIIIAILAR